MYKDKMFGKYAGQTCPSTSQVSMAETLKANVIYLEGFSILYWAWGHHHSSLVRSVVFPLPCLNLLFSLKTTWQLPSLFSVILNFVAGNNLFSCLYLSGDSSIQVSWSFSVAWNNPQLFSSLKDIPGADSWKKKWASLEMWWWGFRVSSNESDIPRVETLLLI